MADGPYASLKVDLAGQTAVVTGASQGLGKAIALALAAAGAKVIMPPTDQFQGERTSKVLDPFGHEWMLGSHIEDVSREEMQRRFDAMFGGAGE